MEDYLWWRDGVIYQIYPRSFYDSNNDGIGDLPGITAKLDYIASLGVDAIWLSPFYPTPDDDFGYDISDHCAVDPRFGTMDDFDDLLQGAHARGLKVILDLVLNHTSDRHPWFLESRASLQNPKRDWYIWRDPKPNGRPPNNWGAVFGGSAWEMDPATGQSYLHLFTVEQPDVNWRNPEVRKAQLDVVRFWLSRSVDGFRLDVFNAYFKDEALRDNPKLPLPIPIIGEKRIHDFDQPEMIPLLQELRSILEVFPDRYAVGETAFASAEKAVSYCGPDKLHAAFSFEFIGLAGLAAGGLRKSSLEKKIRHREEIFSAASIWPTTVMGNHDVPRPASRYGKGESDAKVKLAMALLLTLRGTPYLYYGDEIGMRDINLRRDQILDPLGKTMWPFHKGRDGCRSPMQWDAGNNGGFSEAPPWLPVHENHQIRNVQTQQSDPGSLLNMTRSLISLRKENPALRSGNQTIIDSGSHHVLSFTRSTPEQTILTLINFHHRSRATTALSTNESWQLLYSNYRSDLVSGKTDGFTLGPYEVCLLRNC